MGKRTDRRRGLGVSNDVADADEVLKELEEEGQEEPIVVEETDIEIKAEDVEAIEEKEVSGEEANDILGAFNEDEPIEEVEKAYEPVIDEIKNDEIIDGSSDDATKEDVAGNDANTEPPTKKEEEIVDPRYEFSDVNFGAGISKDLRNMNNDKLNNNNNGGKRMRTTKLSEIIMGKLQKVQNGRSLANFRGFSYILEPQDILKFVGESITEFNPEAKLALDRVKASTIVSTILQTTENIDDGKENRNLIMDRMALEMTGLGFNRLKELRDNHLEVIVLQLPRKGYTTQGDPENIIGGGLKKDYVKAGTILEEFGIITPTKYVPATLFTGDDELRIEGGIQIYTDLYKMSLICTCALYNIFNIADAIGPKGGKIAIEIGAKQYGTYEVTTYLNKGAVNFVK